MHYIVFIFQIPGIISLINYILYILAVIGIISLFLFIIRFFIHSNRTNIILSEKNIELEKMNQQLTESEQQLKKLNSTKAKLFSIIAHDLRSSMNVILGFSEIIVNRQNNLSQTELNKYSNIINQTAHKVYLMMENLLDWSRAQGENIRFHSEEFDLSSTASNVITLLETKAYQKRVELISVIPKPCLVKADKTMVGSILRNLLDNALKFTPSEGKIELSARHVGTMVEVWVSDTGVGMEEEELIDLFRGDSHASTEGTDQEKGTGLGLFICQDFIAMHGGKIWAESRKNAGTVFKFIIPAGKY
jgi:two-component system, sensor histidine kinase and response regulator